MSGTGGNYRPGSLTPSHAGPAACTLGYTSINNNKSNCLLAEIIRPTYTFSFQKQKVAFVNAVNKSFFEISVNGYAPLAYTGSLRPFSVSSSTLADA